MFILCGKISWRANCPGDRGGGIRFPVWSIYCRCQRWWETAVVVRAACIGSCKYYFVHSFLGLKRRIYDFRVVFGGSWAKAARRRSSRSPRLIVEAYDSIDVLLSEVTTCQRMISRAFFLGKSCIFASKMPDAVGPRTTGSKKCVCRRGALESVTSCGLLVRAMSFLRCLYLIFHLLHFGYWRLVGLCEVLY